MRKLGILAVPIAATGLLLASPAVAQLYSYAWNGPAFAMADGTVSLGDHVSGYLVIEGPIANLDGPVTPVEFAFTAGPVTIDETTPLHPLTVVELETDADGEIVAAVIQLVQQVDNGMGGVTYADVICVQSCPAGGPDVDLVFDRDGQGTEIGSGSVPLVASHWSSPSLIGPAVPALSPLGRLALGALVAGAAAFLGWGRTRR